MSAWQEEHGKMPSLKGGDATWTSASGAFAAGFTAGARGVSALARSGERASPANSATTFIVRCR